MILVTVTYLVRAIGSLATVRSCVPAAAVPKLALGYRRRDHGRRPLHGGSNRLRTPRNHIFTSLCGCIYRYKGPLLP